MDQTYPNICSSCGGQYDSTCFSVQCKAERRVKEMLRMESDQLKLFKVTVHVTSEHSAGPNGYRVYILHTDGPSAENKVLGALGRARVHPDKMIYTNEVKGPFTAGDVLVWDEF